VLAFHGRRVYVHDVSRASRTLRPPPPALLLCHTNLTLHPYRELVVHSTLC